MYDTTTSNKSLYYSFSADFSLMIVSHIIILDIFFQREKSSSGECPQKRLSTDNPVPQAKRKRRARKLSSSNESTTSEAPSNSSDLQNVLTTTNIIPGSPSSFVHSPMSIMVGGVPTMPSTSMLLSSTSGGSKDHFKQDAVEGESDVVSKMHAEMLGAGPLSPIQVTFHNTM